MIFKNYERKIKSPVVMIYANFESILVLEDKPRGVLHKQILWL